MAAGVQRLEWGDPGGIVALADLIDTHRGAFEYEWRARFHLPLSVVGKSMTWGEAFRLTRILSVDPGSAVCASIQGWDYAMSREALILAGVYDIQHASKAKRRPAPYPRPWPDENRRTFGRTKLSIARLKEVLAATRADTDAEVISHG